MVWRFSPEHHNYFIKAKLLDPSLDKARDYLAQTSYFFAVINKWNQQSSTTFQRLSNNHSLDYRGPIPQTLIRGWRGNFCLSPHQDGFIATYTATRHAPFPSLRARLVNSYLSKDENRISGPKASDSRDRIFGILSLANDSDELKIYPTTPSLVQQYTQKQQWN